jgi:hypothetical protein
MNTLLSRLYCDYLMPSQLDGFENLVRTAQQAGYLQTSVCHYHDLLRQGLAMPDKVLVHRHDIDTDLRTTRKLFQIEKKYGIKSSFYFRLSTLDFKLMKEIAEYGSEASYHFEEVATFAKANGLKSAAALRARLPEIRSNFINNFFHVEERLGRKLRTVASHGDFVNRRLKISNTEILEDQQLRQHCGIECETYDSSLMNSVDIYITDRPPPEFYFPSPPMVALKRYARIYLLTHPRRLDANWTANTKENLFRAYEGLIW